jgi:2-deoxy-D-gluconate 3-dehydrogenase
MTAFDLTGKVALVTGGNGGIGLGMAKGLAAAGAAVMVAGRDAKKNRRAVEILGASADAIAVDMAQDNGGRAAVAAAVKKFGRLDIVVNNAGSTFASHRKIILLRNGTAC